VARYAASLVVLLSFGPLPLHLAQLTAAQQSATVDARINAEISQTAADFQTRTQRFRAPSKWGYPAGDLNSVLASTRQQLLDDLPREAAPLRAYVLQNFPAAVAGVPPNKKIDMKICSPLLSNANDLLSALKSVNAYRLDLTVDSAPAGALFELKPIAGDKLARASRSTLTNVWRGVYNYTVARDGEKTITGTIDLVREKGNTLRCNFVHQSSPGPALPCDLVTEH